MGYFIFYNYAFLVSPTGSVEVDPTLINGIHGMDYSTLCSSLGGLGNEFQWIYLRTDTQVALTPMLNFSDVSVLDAGYYECVVSNPAGNENATFRLNSK